MAKKTPAAPGELKTYIALTPIEHNGERIEVDQPFDLTDAEAAPLLGVKAVKAAD